MTSRSCAPRGRGHVSQEWEPEDALACWMLPEDDWCLIANNARPSRLGFFLLAPEKGNAAEQLASILRARSLLGERAARHLFEHGYADGGSKGP